MFKKFLMIAQAVAVSILVLSVTAHAMSSVPSAAPSVDPLPGPFLDLSLAQVPVRDGELAYVLRVENTSKSASVVDVEVRVPVLDRVTRFETFDGLVDDDSITYCISLDAGSTAYRLIVLQLQDGVEPCDMSVYAIGSMAGTSGPYAYSDTVPLAECCEKA